MPATALAQASLIARGLALPVMESFLTIQGEGANAGRPAYFIRLGGCDVGCHWCDVKESWDASAHAVYSIDELVEQARQQGAAHVVITGGEPSLHELGPLTQSLQQAGMETWVETSGTGTLTGRWHWVCFSPKRFKAPLESIYQQADELKVVIYHPRDFEFAEKHAAQVRPDCRLYLQPEWSRTARASAMIIDYVKRHPAWSISLQTHKYLDIP